MDGWVTVGTKLDTKELEKDLKNAENKLKQYEREAQKLAQQKAKVDLDLSAYEQEKQKIQEATDLTLQQAQTEEQVNATLELENSELEKLKERYSEVFQKSEDISKSIKENTFQQGLLNNEIQEMNDKLGRVKNLDGIAKSIKNIGNETSKTIKKVAKWALAIFSIRSAYMLVRNAISTLSQYNEQFATDLEYIRFALANTLQPVIQKIVELVKTLLVYIGYIAKAWFGVDLWANSSAESFKKAKDNVNGVSKAAKKLQKQLTGFDEMNILQEDGSTEVGGGGGGTTLPSFDLAAPEDVPVPKWLTWIVANGDLVRSIIAGIVGTLGALKLGLVAGPEAFVLFAIIVQVVDVFQGLVGWIQNLVKWFQDPSWENFVNFWRSSIENMGIVGDLILWIFDLFGGFDKVVEPLHTFYNWIKDVAIPNIITFVTSIWDTIVAVFSPIISFFANIFTAVWQNITATVGNIIQVFMFLWNNIVAIFGPIISFFGDIFTKAWATIKEVFGPFVEFFQGLFNKVGTKLKEWGGKVGDIIGKAFKGAVNGVLGAIESILNTPIKAINGLIKIINKIPGINLTKLKTFNLPRLAQGGIISQPGRGVPVGYGQAIGGERGREGVIPLTDSQQMALLGEAIGRYININLTNITKLDNRQIAREQKIINARNDFAFNR